MWLSRLVPYLTGERTLGELTESLSAERRALVERLVGLLAEQRFVVDARADEPHALSAEESAVYAAEIAFIRYGFDSAEHRFERLRRARIVVVATGPAGPVPVALVEAGLGSGWRDVRTVVAADLSAAIERCRRDGAQTVRAAAGIPDDADVVLHVHSGEAVDDLLEVARVCERGDIALGQIWVREDEAWTTPVSDVEAASYWRRLTGLPHDPDGEGVDWLTGPVPAVVAAQAALSCFEYLTGMTSPPVQPAMIRVDLRTLDTRRHRVYPFVQASDSGGRNKPGSLVSGKRLEAEELRERASSHVNPRVGVLGGLDEGDLVQTPLSMCRATVSDPRGVLPSWAPAPRVVGWGPDRQTARLRALLAGLATYQALAEEERPVVPYRAPIGVAAGLSWSQAVAAGLAQHCEAFLCRSGDGAFPIVPALADPEVGRLVGLLEAAGERPEIRDLTTELGVPAYAAGNARPACGASPVAAMRRALERLLLAWQARTERGPCYADPVSYWGDEEEAEAAVEVFTRALADVGRAPAISVLGRDREVARLLPYVVRVDCDE
ncbi:YcaO-like family protein [Actinoallomurus purpureus]|uniref:YcaO-like family protein n=1 Tax=Actinoallomurus purpureus TaxID=478114 RepID=UPI002092629B|nr:YcaO-like family protein [Actinoallomurus purpureus]MCO6006960.1 YcaO-like family protein [Actinoallomurus purpureus]